MEEKKSYYAIIPSTVRYDPDITPNAKLLYGEITALSNENGYCWATNDYFAKLYGVSKTSISKWIATLVKKGYLHSEIIYKEGTKEISNRYLKLLEYPIKEKLNTPIEEKLKENNTFINNKKKEINKERKTNFTNILSAIEDVELKDLYFGFIEMREFIKKPMTDMALKILITKVNKLEPNSIERQKQILETSITNNWKSVYPIKEDSKKEIRDFEKRGYDKNFIDSLVEQL